MTSQACVRLVHVFSRVSGRVVGLVTPPTTPLNHILSDRNLTSEPHVRSRNYDEPVAGIVKSLYGGILDGQLDLQEPWALVVTQTYAGVRWISNDPAHNSGDEDISLPGAKVDGPNAGGWIARLVQGIRVIAVQDASKDKVERAQGTNGCFLYFQGHNVRNSEGVGLYLTSQQPVVEDWNWDGLSTEVGCGLFGFSGQQLKVLQGNAKAIGFDRSFTMESHRNRRLRFVLHIEGDRAEWQELADEWSGNELCSPTVHLSGSRWDELAHEHVRTGGFFTQALTEHRDKLLTLPNLLRAIRSGVQDFLDAGKRGGAIKAYHTQTPEIFSSVKLSLEDTHALIGFMHPNA
ncbi:hypothetical protein FRC12_003716 [Ceratobasidium sp. 428]|nr:hypothetical protein FRC12_003716 [Ceratobasidium sp. 428]